MISKNCLVFFIQASLQTTQQNFQLMFRAIAKVK